MKKIGKVSIIYSSSRAPDSIIRDVQKTISGVKIDTIDTFSVNSISKNLKRRNFLKPDLFIVIGGDGTMIGSIRGLFHLDVPFLGINLGTVGFLTDIYPDNLSQLEKVLKGNYAAEKRSIYRAGFSSKNQDIFVNEVVVHSGSIAKMVQLELSTKKETIYSLRADGLIISSSTGSTAYSYSGGGPIISPDLGAFSLLPMFSFSSSSHSLILPDNQDLIVKIENPSSDIDIVVDGKKKLNYSSKGLEISNTKKYFYLYHPKDYNYFNACRSKLGWALPIEGNKNDK